MRELEKERRSWIDSVELSVRWRCVCGKQLYGPGDKIVCQCGRTWRAKTNLNIGYGEPKRRRTVTLETSDSLFAALDEQRKAGGDA